MHARKFNKLIIIFLLVAVIGLIGFFIYKHNISKELPVSDQFTPHHSQNQRVQIRGLNFTGYDNGEKVISIKADKFTIKKKEDRLFNHFAF